MSEETETPQQRQARIRQQKREAKAQASAQASAQERLDKIMQASGRPAEILRDESPAQVTTIPQAATTTGTDEDPAEIPPTASMFGQSNDPEQIRMQQEYMRALLSGVQQDQRGAGLGQQSQQQGMPDMSDENDPMLKMMQAMMGNMSGDPNAPGPGDMPFSADDISKMTGMPSFLTSTFMDMFMGGKPKAPPTAEVVKRERTWKMIRVIVSMLIGLYTLFTVDRSVETFGQSPPAPATVQNPFVVFLMGELLLNGARVVLSGQSASQSGVKSWIQTGRETARDGAVLVFHARRVQLVERIYIRLHKQLH